MFTVYVYTFYKNYFIGKVKNKRLQPVNYKLYYKRFINVIIYRT